MSEENVERVRFGFEVFNQGDYDTALEGIEDHVEWHVLEDMPDAQVYRGPSEIRKFWEAWRDMFDEFHVEPEEIIDAGDEIVVMIRVRGRGRESGAEVDTPAFPQVWSFRDGRVINVAMYQSREKALRAAGIEEPSRGSR
jgi:ketosteroid isomerase-like protein